MRLVLWWMIAHVSPVSTWCTVLPGHLKNMRLDGRVVVDDCPCLSPLYVGHCSTWPMPLEEYEAWWECCGGWLPMSLQPLTWCTVLPGHLKNMRLDGSVVVDDGPCLSNLYVVAHSLQQVQSHSMIWKNIIQVFNLYFLFYKNISCFYNRHFLKDYNPEKNDIKKEWLVKFLLINMPSHLHIFVDSGSPCMLFQRSS